MSAVDWLKLAVTYAVPYCVATYGAARYAVSHGKAEPGEDAGGDDNA
jgi:hypothetical protein